MEPKSRQVIELRGTLGLLSLLGLFWSGSAMFSAMSRSINRAWDIHRDRPFYIRKLRDLVMALSTGIMFLLSMGATSVFTIMRRVDFPVLAVTVNLAGRSLAFFLVLTIFLLIYKYIPNTTIRWRDVWPGALLVAVLFEIARSSFVLYLDNFANYGLVYGSIASVIVLLVWIYFSAFILILGAEFSSEYIRMRHGVNGNIHP
ncbi:YihY/virulence factor BrkB family protein [Chloroflexota bacterium]